MTKSAKPGDGRPILLLGLPRGMTSKAFQVIAKMTRRIVPDFTTNGEILNFQRFRWEKSSLAEDHPLRLALRDFSSSPHSKDAGLFEAVAKALGAVPDGWIIKDVVQPWACLDYLEKNPDRFEVFYLRRDLAHINFALGFRGWNYVSDAEGIDHAFRERFRTISTTAMQFDETYLADKLGGYGLQVKDVSYLDGEFIKSRDEFFVRYYKSVAEVMGETSEEERPATKVSRADVIWAYRLLLDREPDSEHLVRHLMRLGSRKVLVRRLITSDEFTASGASGGRRTRFIERLRSLFPSRLR